MWRGGSHLSQGWSRRVRDLAPLAEIDPRHAFVHSGRLHDCLRCAAFHRGLNAAMYALSSFIAGLVFGIGLIVSGMVNPAKVLGFLDLAGAWDPSLALVMAGA